jgi:hypothetical protein
MKDSVPAGVKLSKKAHQFNTKTLDPIKRCFDKHFGANQERFVEHWGYKFPTSRFFEKCKGEGQKCPTSKK